MAGTSTEQKLAIHIAGKADSSLHSAVNSAQKALSSLGTAAAKVAKVTAAAVGAATTAAVAFAKEAVDVGMQFDSSMSQVAATMGYSVEELNDSNSEAAKSFEALRDFAMEMGSTTAFSASQAADGLNILAMSGLSAKEQIAALPDVMNLAAAGALDLSSSAAYVTGAVKGFQDEMDNAQKYTDLIAKGATLANTSVSGLGEAMSRSAANAKNYNQGADSLTLSLLRLAEQNIEGEAAATALNRAMSDLYAPTASAQKALDELKISAYDETGAARDFNEVVDELNQRLSGMTDEQRNAKLATIFTTQGLNAFNKMVSASPEKLDKFKEGLQNSFGSAAQQAATQLDNLQGDITLWQSALEGAQIVISDQLTPTLREFVQFGTKSLEELTTAFKVGGLTAAMQTLGTVLSNAINMIVEKLPMMVDAGMQLLGALGQGLIDNIPVILDAVFKIATMLIKGVLSSLPRIADAAIEIVKALANGIAQNLPELAAAAVEAVSAMADGVTQNLPELVKAAGKIITTFLSAISSSLPTIISVYANLISQMAIALTDPKTITEIIAAALGVITALADGLLKAIPILIEAAPTVIQNLIDAILQAIPLIIDTGVQLLLALVDNLPAIIRGIAQAIPQIISGLVSALVKAAPLIARTGVELFAALVESLPQIIGTIVASVPVIAKNLAEAFATILPGELGGALSGIFDVLAELGQAIYASVQAILPEVISLIQSLIPVVLQIVQDVLPLAIQMIQGILPPLMQVVQMVLPVLTQLIQQLLPFITQIVQAILPVLTSFIQTLLPLITDIVQGVMPILIQLLQSILPIAMQIIQAVLPIIIQLIQTLLPPLMQIINAILPVITPLLQAVLIPLTNLIQTILPPLQALLNAIIPVVQMLASVLSSVLGAALTHIGDLIGSVVTIFSGLMDFITGVFTGNWEQAWNGIKDIFSGIFDGIAAIFKAPIRAIVAVINGVISGLNMLKIPDWVPEIGGMGLNIPLIPEFAKGTLKTPDTFIAGEEGPELITNAPGRRVYTAAQTKNILAAQSGASTPIDAFFEQLNSVSIFQPNEAQGRSGEGRKVISPIDRIIEILYEQSSAVSNFNSKERLQEEKIREAKNGSAINIPALAEGGIVTASTMALIGEGGEPEAVMPLSKLVNFLNEFSVINNKNEAATANNATNYLTEQTTNIGAGTPANDWIGNTLDVLSGDDSSEYSTENSSPITITYSPQYSFGGTPTRDDMVEAEKMSQAEFRRMANEWLKEMSRTNLKGVLT